MVSLSSFIKLIFSLSFSLFSFFFTEPKPSTSPPFHFFFFYFLQPFFLSTSPFFFLLHLSSPPNPTLLFSPSFFISFFLLLLATHQLLPTKLPRTQNNILWRAAASYNIRQHIINPFFSLFTQSRTYH